MSILDDMLAARQALGPMPTRRGLLLRCASQDAAAFAEELIVQLGATGVVVAEDEGEWLVLGTVCVTDAEWAKITALPKLERAIHLGKENADDAGRC
jgi:hypothetical protein